MTYVAAEPTMAVERRSVSAALTGRLQRFRAIRKDFGQGRKVTTVTMVPFVTVGPHHLHTRLRDPSIYLVQ